MMYLLQMNTTIGLTDWQQPISASSDEEAIEYAEKQVQSLLTLDGLIGITIWDGKRFVAMVNVGKRSVETSVRRGA